MVFRDSDNHGSRMGHEHSVAANFKKVPANTLSKRTIRHPAGLTDMSTTFKPTLFAYGTLMYSFDRNAVETKICNFWMN